MPRDLAAVPDPPEPTADPHDIAAEQVVLGAMLLSAEAINTVAGVVSADDFYRPAHGLIFETITAAHADGHPTDPVAVNAALTRDGTIVRIGGAPYLHTLVGAVPAAANAGHYARIVADLAHARTVIETGHALIEHGRTGRGTDALENARTRLADTATPVRQWPDPTPLDAVEGQLPEFPLECLPPWVGQYAAAVSDATQTPPDLAGCLALAALSTAASGRVWADTGEWTEPVCLYTVVAMPPASRKSAVFGAMTRALGQAETRLVEAAWPQISDARVAARVARARADEYLTKAERDRDPESIAAATQEDQDAAAAERAVPPLPELSADDITPESLDRQISEQGGRLALLSPEGGFFGTLAGRYSGMPNLNGFLKAHAGEEIRVKRSEHAARCPHAMLTIGITLQPDVLREVFATPTGRGSGMLARILYALPADNVGHRTGDAVPVPPEVETEYEQRLQALLFSLRPLEEPATLTFTPEARDRIRHLKQTEVEKRLRPDGDLGGIRDWGGKYVGCVVRIAALLHLAGHLTDGWAQPITADTLESAYRIGEYYAVHARAVFDQMDTDHTHQTARRILDHLTARRIRQTTKRDLFNAIRSKQIAKAADLDAPLALLCDLGWLREETPPPTGRKGGRPPSPKYTTHPDLANPRPI